MRERLGALLSQHAFAPGLKPGTPETDVVGQEPREASHLDHREQAAGAERGERLAQRAVRIGQVMQGR
jgi:hypothetical protein